MAARISCPVGGSQVAVMGSGSAGVICVHGTYVEDKFGGSVRVRVQPQGTPADPTSDYVDTVVSGQAWCARSVPVPSGSSGSSGASALTVFVWTLLPASGGTTTRLDDQQNFGGVPGPASGLDDCCAGCGSGTPEAGPYAQAAANLAADAAVRVTVPDGPGAGHHTAGPVARLTWQAVVGKAVWEVKLCPADGLLVRVDGRPVEAAAVRFDPLSAVLPGAAFGAAGPVLVTQA
jgi:hypothetical protein